MSKKLFAPTRIGKTKTPKIKSVVWLNRELKRQLPPSRQLTQHLVKATQVLATSNLRQGRKLVTIKITVAFGDDKDMRRVKKLFWHKNQTSDVASFGSINDSEVEILINVAQANRQRPGSLIQEVIFLYIHGLLHILGYEDNAPKKRQQMLELGQEILSNLKI